VTPPAFADSPEEAGWGIIPGDPKEALMRAWIALGGYLSLAVGCGGPRGSVPTVPCAHVKGPKGEVTLRIVDLCPECPKGNLDLSPDAFSRIADLGAGRVPITWEYLPCDVAGPIRYHFKEGSNPWWTAVQIRNHRNRIASLQYRRPDGSYAEVPRTDYNFFVQASGMGPGPYSFRVTDVYGNVLEDEGIPHVEGGEAPGTGQFPPCGG
jgi:expansin (peptidoglycan-binding protein)